MRELNEAEKELCNQILEKGSDYFSIASLLDKHLPSISIKHKKPDEVTVSLSAEHIDPKDLDKIQSNMSYTGSLILAAVNLLGMLEREGYILFIQRVPYTDDEIGRAPVNARRINFEFPDKTLNERFIGYVKKDIIVTEEFKVFCKNGYLTRHERRQRKQQKITIGILTVGVLALIVNLAINVYQWCSFIE